MSDSEDEESENNEFGLDGEFNSCPFQELCGDYCDKCS